MYKINKSVSTPSITAEELYQRLRRHIDELGKDHPETMPRVQANDATRTIRFNDSVLKLEITTQNGSFEIGGTIGFLGFLQRDKIIKRVDNWVAKCLQSTEDT